MEQQPKDLLLAKTDSQIHLAIKSRNNLFFILVAKYLAVTSTLNYLPMCTIFIFYLCCLGRHSVFVISSKNNHFIFYMNSAEPIFKELITKAVAAPGIHKSD
jgi:hypothetical protein